jgi:hypothetical protein
VRFSSAFSYLTPGVVAQRTHTVDWNEADRHSKWSKSSLPLMRTPLSPPIYKEQAPTDMYDNLPCHEDVRLVQQLLGMMDPDGFLIEAAPALLAEPTSDELARIATSYDLRAVMVELMDQVRGAYSSVLHRA